MKKVCFINGCFDVLHYGHLSLIKHGYENSDFLIIAIDSDERIKNNKGNERPFNNQNIRSEFLLSLRYVDRVVVFEDDEKLKKLVEYFSPDLMIVGEEYKDKHVIGGEYAKSIEFFPKIKGFSSTKIIHESIINR